MKSSPPASRPALRLALLLVLVATACSPTRTASPGPSPYPAWTPKPEYSDFYCQMAAGSGDSWGIYLVDPAGSNLQRLTQAGEHYRYPRFSPDGQYLAFVKACEPQGAVVLYDRRSGAMSTVAAGTATFGSPTWSPDSRYLAFTKAHERRAETIVFEPGRGVTTRIVQWAGQLSSLTWSPDGRRVAFAATTGDGFEIYAVGVDGSSLTRLTTTGGFAFAPSWSPVDQALAYVKLDYPVLGEGLYDGSLQLLLLTSPGLEPTTLARWTSSRPVWSPDGQWLTAGRQGSDIVSRSGLTQTTIISGIASYAPQAWSSRGIVFDTCCCSLCSILVVDPKDRGRLEPLGTHLNHALFWQREATWAPEADLLAFSGLLNPPIP